MDDALKRSALVLGLLVLVLVLLNIFVFVPQLTEKPGLPARYTTESPETAEPEEVVIKDTLAGIRETAAGKRYIPPGPVDGSRRNPFFWPEEMKEPVVTEEVPVANTVTVPAPERKKPQLGMTIIGEQRKEAILDDVFVSEGDMFHGYLVKKIGADEVVLVDKHGELRIRAGEGEENGAPAPAVLIER